VRPAVNSWNYWRATSSGSADIWGNDIVLNELTKLGILNSNQRTMRGLAVVIREATIRRMIRHTNLLTFVRLGGLDPIPQKDMKLKIVSSHGGLDLRNG